MISIKYLPLLQSFLLSGFMSFIMSGIIIMECAILEHKKRRLTFEVVVKDSDATLYAKAKVTNWQYKYFDLFET